MFVSLYVTTCVTDSLCTSLYVPLCYITVYATLYIIVFVTTYVTVCVTMYVTVCVTMCVTVCVTVYVRSKMSWAEDHFSDCIAIVIAFKEWKNAKISGRFDIGGKVSVKHDIA